MNPAISSFVPPVAPQAPAQASSAPPSQPGFSKMLSQAQARDTQAAPAEASPEAQASRAATQKGEKAGKAEQGAQSEGSQKADKAESADKTDKDDKAEASDGDAAERDVAADKPVADPALADWMASLQRPVAQQDAARRGGDAPEPEADADAATSSPKGGAARGSVAGAARDLKGQEAADVRGAKAKAAEAPVREAAESSSFKAELARAGDRHREAQPAFELPVAPHAVAPGVAPAHGAARGVETAAPVSAHLPTPATSPDFAQALGVQVSVLAKDGVQQAELHLNPADMGPISVRIALDGTQAQVNFGADSAATRQIIENGLPELAASLRDAGFTLSGGGVHSQAQGREQGGEGERGEGRSGARAIGGIETDVTVRRATARVSAGGVDLYA